MTKNVEIASVSTGTLEITLRSSGEDGSIEISYVQKAIAIHSEMLRKNKAEGDGDMILLRNKNMLNKARGQRGHDNLIF